MDLNKYSVQSKPTTTTNLDSYGVASTAPTMDELLSVKTVTAPQENTTLTGKLGNRLSQAGQSITDPVYPGQQVLGVTGAAGGAVNDVVEAIINPFFTKLVDTVSDNSLVQKVATSKLGGKATDAANSGISSLMKSGQDFAAEHPATAQFAKDVFNTASLVPAGAASKEGVNISKDAVNLSRRALTPSESSTQKSLITMFNKAVKPTAKKTAATAERYDNNVVTALREISDNAPNLNIEDVAGEIVNRAPQSLNELSQALDQTKAAVFTKYNTLAQKTGDTGALLKVEPIAAELDAVGANKALSLTAPEVVKYAQSWAERLRSFGDLDVPTGQEIVKMMNKNLESFYKNPTYESASRVAIDAGIANNFRRELDNIIETATGENYQALKSTYGSLKAIENDVVRAALRDARRNTKGLLDYTDMFTSGQMVGGILSLNPAMFTKGAIERGFKEYIKVLNDPNRVIKGIFDAIDRQKSDFVPKSKTLKLLNDRYPDGVPAGLSTKAVAIKGADLDTAEKFIDHMEGVSKVSGSDLTELKANAQRIAEKVGIEPTLGDKALANALRKQLDAQNFSN